MYNYPLSLFAGLLAMGFVITSYFLKKKSLYLLFQAAAIFLLAISYLFLEEFFALVAYLVSMVRVIIYFCYEKDNKEIPLLVKCMFAALVIAVYFTVNIAILKQPKTLDVICVAANVLYSFIFGIRNLKLMRYSILAPNGLALLYNILVKVTPFVIVSYSFELLANIVSIIKFKYYNKETNLN